MIEFEIFVRSMLHFSKEFSQLRFFYAFNEFAILAHDRCSFLINPLSLSLLYIEYDVFASTFFIFFTQKKTLPGHIPSKAFYIIIVNP